MAFMTLEHSLKWTLLQRRKTTNGYLFAFMSFCSFSHPQSWRFSQASWKFLALQGLVEAIPLGLGSLARMINFEFNSFSKFWSTFQANHSELSFLYSCANALPKQESFRIQNYSQGIQKLERLFVFSCHRPIFSSFWGSMESWLTVSNFSHPHFPHQWFLAEEYQLNDPFRSVRLALHKIYWNFPWSSGFPISLAKFIAPFLSLSIDQCLSMNSAQLLSSQVKNIAFSHFLTTVACLSLAVGRFWCRSRPWILAIPQGRIFVFYPNSMVKYPSDQNLFWVSFLFSEEFRTICWGSGKPIRRFLSSYKNFYTGCHWVMIFKSYCIWQ